jgi:hypothetical protein
LVAACDLQRGATRWSLSRAPSRRTGLVAERPLTWSGYPRPCRVGPEKVVGLTGKGDRKSIGLWLEDCLLPIGRSASERLIVAKPSTGHPPQWQKEKRIMGTQPVWHRPTCSLCCKPWSDEDPGRLVESHRYLVAHTAPASDPSQPDCSIIQLSPDLILCSECFAKSGYGGQAAGASARERPKRRGRPSNTDPARDRRIADAWRIGRHLTRQQLADAFGLKKQEVICALDRHRKRKK